MSGGIRHDTCNPITLAFLAAALLLVGLVFGDAPTLAAQEITEEVTPPTLTPTATTTATSPAAPSDTPEPSATELSTASPTVTPEATGTAIPATQTPVIQTVEVPVPATVIVPATPVAPPIIIPTPPVVQPAPPVASPTSIYGWTRYESIAFIQMTGNWALLRDRMASAGAYHESSNAGARLRFAFTGEGIRLIYRAHPAGGRLGLLLDGQPLAEIETRAESASYRYAGPFFFESGYHVLDVMLLAAESGMTSAAIDAVDIFRGPPLPVPATRDDQASDDRRDIADIRLIAGPATPAPTPTAIPAALVMVEIVIAYDVNRNRHPDPDEGVRGMPVRLLDATSNSLLASGLTDERGFVRLQTVTANPVTAVVPYLGETFTVRAPRGRGQIARWTLLLEAGTQPGLIP